MNEPKYDEPIEDVQEEPIVAPVRVEVVNQVVTKSAPSIDGDFYSITLPAEGDVDQLAGGDPRRQRAVIISSVEFYVATSRDQVRNSNAGLWPAGVVLDVRHRAEIWVRATATDQVITASVERWAD